MTSNSSDSSATGNVGNGLSWKGGLLFATTGIAAFHTAFGLPALSFLILVFLYSVVRLTNLPTSRQAFYLGLATGYAVYAPHLMFFWTIFGWPAIALWTVLAFWLGLFVALGRMCRLRFGPVMAALMIPFVWTGLEYFRSELYYLRFSWLSVGCAFPQSTHLLTMTGLGVYGIGWALAACVSGVTLLKGTVRAPVIPAILMATALVVNIRPAAPPDSTPRKVHVAGVQLEFPDEERLVPALDRIVRKDGSVELIVLSEYTLQRPPTREIRDWCKRNQRYLAIGGKDFPPDSKFANTLFVIDPNGEIVFRQVKCVPVQFFDDGIPATEQWLWDSPWGRIGFCICYDLSYRKITDRLVQLGAEALVVISADETGWGLEQHLQHARVAPTRAAEHRIPIFRVACTGISQWVAPDGRVLASASFPGQGEIIRGQLELARPGRLPFDHWFAPVCAGVTAVVTLWMAAISFRIRGRKS